MYGRSIIYKYDGDYGDDIKLATFNHVIAVSLKSEGPAAPLSVRFEGPQAFFAGHWPEGPQAF